MGSPVRGFRAVRAERTEVAKDPKPTSETVCRTFREGRQITSVRSNASAHTPGEPA